MLGTDLFVRFIGLDLVSRVAERAGNSIDRMENRIRRGGIAASQSLIAAGIAATTFGVSLLAVAGGLSAIAANSVEAAAQFRSDMVMVVTHAGLARDQVDGVSEALMRMAPAVGFGPDELAKAFYHVQSATTSLPERLQSVAAKEDILRQAAMLAAVGHADLTDTTNTLLSVLASYGRTSMTAADAAAQLNAIVGNGNVTMQQFDSAMRGGLLPVAAQAGVHLNSLGAAFGTLTDMGYGASQAATYLRSAIIQMSMPSGPASKALQAIGLSGDQAAKQMGFFNEILHKAGINQTVIANELQKSGSLSHVLNDVLEPALRKAGLSGHDAAALIERSFGGIRSGAGIVGLTDNLQGLADKENLIQRSTSEWASTWKYFASNDPAFVIKQMRASFDVLRITIGDALMPTFLQLANFLGPLITRFRDWVNSHKELVAHITAAAIAVTGILGVILLFAGGALILAGSLGVIAGVVGSLSGVLPVIAAAALIAAGAFVALRPHAGELANLFRGLRGPIVDVITALHTSVSSQQWRDFATAAGKFLDILGPILMQLAKLQVGAWSGELRALAAFIRVAFPIAVQALTAAMNLFVTIVHAAEAVSARVRGVILAAVAAFGRARSAVMEFVNGVRDDFGRLESGITTTVVHLLTFLEKTWQTIRDTAESAWRQFSERPGYWTGYMVGFVIGSLIHLVQEVDKKWGELINGEERLGMSMAEGAKRMGEDFVTTVVQWIQSLPGRVQEFFDDLLGRSVSFGSDLGQQGSAAGQSFLDSIGNFFSQLPDRAGQFLQELVDRASQLPGQLIDIGAQSAQGFVDGVTGMYGSVLSQIQGFFQGIVDGVKAGLGISSPSRVFKMMVGVPIAQGVESGIHQGAPAVRRAAIGMVDSAHVGASSVARQNSEVGSADPGGSDDDRLVSLLSELVDEVKRQGRSNRRAPDGTDSSNLIGAALQTVNEKAARGRLTGQRAVFA